MDINAEVLILITELRFANRALQSEIDVLKERTRGLEEHVMTCKHAKPEEG